MSSQYKSNLSLTADPAPARSKLSKEQSQSQSQSKQQSDHLLSYYQSSIPNEARSHARSASTPHGISPSVRPTPAARKMSTTSMSSESDYSYDSDRDYSYESGTNESKEPVSEASSSATRRSGTPSKGGADRRRMAIVQMDTATDRAYKSSSETTSSASIRSRRGHKSSLSGLALVAPPDAALRTYTQFTPPSTAPVSGDYMAHVLLTATQEKGHNRSSSENPSSKKTGPSRDVPSTATSIQGTQSLLSSANTSRQPRGTTKDDDADNNNAFPNPKTTRKSRSPSPDFPTAKDDRDRSHGLLSPPTTAYPSAHTIDIDMFSPIVTPKIGQGKEIHMPVAGPVVVKLDNVQSRRVESTPSWRNELSPPTQAQSSVYGSPATQRSTSPYLYYEPGVHATAGPLPPPPRTTININVSTPPPPRPPRLHSPAPPRMRSDIEAVKQALQLPPSVTAVLAARSSSKPSSPKPDEKEVEKLIPKERNNEDGESLTSHPSIHRREGATLATSSIDTSSTESSPALPNQPSPKPPSPGLPVVQEVDKPSSSPENPADDVPAVTVVEASAPTNTPPTEKVDTAKFDQWLKENPHLSRAISQDEGRRDSTERSLSPLSADITGDAPSPPPKSFRNSLTNNLKRFSTLPRSPSLSSRSRPSSGSTRYSRTPSPSLHHLPPPPHRSSRPSFQKIQSSNPAALFCHEVNSQHTTIQRCAIYVAKINELYVHDCGLSEWVVETKSRGSSNPHSMQRGPSSQPFVSQPRQTSRSSMISEATFPIRPDASVATDLMQGAYRDITPPNVPPPALPYPSLAVNPPRSTQPSRSNSSATSGTPPSSVRSLVSSPSTKGAGFFASLGRKASLSSRKERFPPTPLSSSSGTISSNSGRSMAKNPPSTANISRPVLISGPPSVPGGPRALPRRAQRSQTFTSSALPNSERDDSMGRRPSLFNLTLDTVIDIQPDPAFTRQVDQLAALLPHADRDVLAGYLRRAGQDMLAIGQYLEDEKMGTIRQPF